MSKNNNVNPGQYKVRGRERQGEDIVPEEEKAELTRTAHELREQAKWTQPSERARQTEPGENKTDENATEDGD
jgi:hypothetical protein